MASDSVLLDIVQNVQTVLTTLLTGTGAYHHALKKFYLEELPLEDRGPAPNITLIDFGASLTPVGFGDPIGFAEGTLSLTLECVVTEALAGKMVEQSLHMLEDIKRALAVDPTRGGKARYTTVADARMAPAFLFAPYGVLYCEIRISLGESYSDPTIAN